MLVRKCDKCGKVIEKNYWSVVFNQHPDEYGRYTTDGVLTNIKQNQTQKEYCYECVQDFQKYLEEK